MEAPTYPTANMYARSCMRQFMLSQCELVAAPTGKSAGAWARLYITGPFRTLTQQDRGSHIADKHDVRQSLADSAWLASRVRDAEIMQAIWGCRGTWLHCKTALRIPTVQYNS